MRKERERERVVGPLFPFLEVEIVANDFCQLPMKYLPSDISEKLERAKLSSAALPADFHKRNEALNLK